MLISDLEGIKIKQIKDALSFCFLIIFILISDSGCSQNVFSNSILRSNFNIQPNLGLSQYYGDFNEKTFWNQHPRFAFGAVLGYQINPIFGLRGQFLKTNLYSERSDQNIVFSSNLWDAGLNVTININEVLANYIASINKKSVLKFYLYSGAGISSFKSKLNDLETGDLIIEHTSRQNEFFLPLGAGAVCKLSNNYSVNLEYSDHTIFGGTKLDFTDKVKKNNDHYSYISLGLQIRIGVKDADNDGVVDKDDLCPGLYGKPEQAGCPDNDNDGIPDKDDDCPDVTGAIEFKGCPDRDGDGIIDRADDCPNVAGKRELNGCPDRDDDGVADKDDKCPYVSGKKELAGCPDSDGDGVTDVDDKCPNLPGKKDFAGCPDRDGDKVMDLDDKCPDLFGKIEFAGCPDSDGDGITDNLDACPNVAGKRELAGCPDRDSDGVADNSDDCPDKKGLAKFNGCPDTDGDGVPDNNDECPGVAGDISNKGCPKITRVAEITFYEIVYFDPGSFTVIPTFRNTIILDEIVTYMNANPNAEISITGFEDANEAEYKNFHLSEKRVDYVLSYLKQKGVNPSKIKKSYLGKKNPVADNKSAEGRTLNRRVEIKITK